MRKTRRRNSEKLNSGTELRERKRRLPLRSTPHFTVRRRLSRFKQASRRSKQRSLRTSSHS